MVTLLITALLFVAFTTLADIIGVWLVVRKLYRPNIIRILTHFAVGTLLAFALLDLLPEALENGNTETIVTTVLLGIVGFYILERFIAWHKHHEEACEIHPQKSSAREAVVFVGATLEEFIDGIAIGLTVVLAQGSLVLPLLASIAVFAHEFPDSVARTVAFINAGTAPSRAMRKILLTTLGSFFGAFLAVTAAFVFSFLLPILTALAVAAFLYIAASHLIPELHHAFVRRLFGLEIAAMAFGIILIAMLGMFE